MAQRVQCMQASPLAPVPTHASFGAANSHNTSTRMQECLGTPRVQWLQQRRFFYISLRTTVHSGPSRGEMQARPINDTQYK
mmetsp:Transcript_19812/g.31713  ORF Transcript_19812/g.31713 Transcript_19812/m.31713 type:complete len:81 (-) Transcript_19812:902-1144(-)